MCLPSFPEGRHTGCSGPVQNYISSIYFSFFSKFLLLVGWRTHKRNLDHSLVLKIGACSQTVRLALILFKKVCYLFYFIFKFISDFQKGLYIFLVLKQNESILLPKSMFLTTQQQKSLFFTFFSDLVQISNKVYLFVF